MANVFVRGLVKGSLICERFFETPPYNINELKARANGIISVMENKQQVAKSVVIYGAQNNSDVKSTKEMKERLGH